MVAARVALAEVRVAAELPERGGAAGCPDRAAAAECPDREAAECLAEAKAAWYDDRHDEDLVMYGPVGKCVEAYIPARRKEGREPVIVTPDTKPPEDMPYFDFMVREALIDIRWGETLAENGVATEGDVTTVRLKSGKAIRCATFRKL